MPSTRFLKSKLMDFFVRVDNILKFKTLLTIRMMLLKNLDRLIALMNLAHAINCTHNELIKVSSEKKI